VSTPFSWWLATRLHDLSMTQTDLASAVGLSASYVNDIVRGRRIPPRSTVLAIAAATDGTGDYLSTLAGHLPPSMDGIREDDVIACVMLLKMRQSMRAYDADVQGVR